MFIRFILLLLMLLTAPSAFAQLHWPTLQVEREAEVQAAAASGSFAFTNVGDQPITITRVRTSCGCTTAALDKTTYAPGESGTITATLNIGSRTGVQRKHVTVHWREVDAEGATTGADDSPGFGTVQWCAAGTHAMSRERLGCGVTSGA